MKFDTIPAVHFPGELRLPGLWFPREESVSRLSLASR
jgi:hypothetical protein